MLSILSNKKTFGLGSQTEYYLLCLVIFVFGVGFTFYSTLCFVAFAAVIVSKTDFLDWKTLILLLFTASYVFIDSGNYLVLGLFGKFKFIVLTLTSYMVGKKIFRISSNRPIRAIVLFFMIQIGWMVEGMLSFYFTMVNAPEILLTRHYYGFFDNSGGTTHGLNMFSSFIIAIASMPYVLYILYKNAVELKLYEKIVLVLVVVAGLAGIVINNKLQNRSPFVVLLIATFLPIFFLPKQSRNLSKLNYFMLLVVVVVLVAAILLYLGYSRDDFLSNETSSRLDREELSTNGRMDVWLLGLEKLPFYPFGGYVLPSYFSYFHNFWLDIAKVSGYIPLALILVFQFAHFRRIANIILSKFSLERGLLMIFLTCILFMFFTEPVPEGGANFYYFSFLVFGYISMIGTRRTFIQKKYIRCGSVLS